MFVIYVNTKSEEQYNSYTGSQFKVTHCSVMSVQLMKYDYILLVSIDPIVPSKIIKYAITSGKYTMTLQAFKSQMEDEHNIINHENNIPFHLSKQPFCSNSCF